MKELHLVKGSFFKINGPILQMKLSFFLGYAGESYGNQLVTSLSLSLWFTLIILFSLVFDAALPFRNANSNCFLRPFGYTLRLESFSFDFRPRDYWY